MKLEKYTKQSGAYFKEVWREVIEDAISNFKGLRATTVENIIVTVLLESGETHSFQGDETSQNRFARSGWAMEKKSVQTINWITADNKLVELTVNDIANILLASGQAQTTVWFKEYIK